MIAQSETREIDKSTGAQVLADVAAGKFFKGKELTKKLSELAEGANHHHISACQAHITTLEHAKLAGDCLRAAKRILGHRTKWSKWRNTYFKASPETARAYMRVSRNWDHPRFEDARRKGIEVKSIRGFFDVIKGETLKPARFVTDEVTGQEFLEDEETQELKEENHESMIRDWVRKEFATWLKGLDLFELEVLEHDIHKVLQRLYGELKDTVCAVTGMDYYLDPDIARRRYQQGKLTAWDYRALSERRREIEKEEARVWRMCGVRRKNNRPQSAIPATTNEITE